MTPSLLAALLVLGGVGHSNSPTIRIKYEVQDASGVAKAELWVTTDDGKTWTRAGEDEDLKPPIEFAAPADGRYGFKLVLEDAVGNRNPDPRPGQPPDLVMVVDTKPPELSLSLSGRFAGPRKAVTVTWSCEDPNLSAAPLSLYLASGEREKLLAVSLQASGSFEYKPEPGLEGEFRFVAAASDLAKNVSKAQSETVTVDPLIPSAVAIAPKKIATDRLSVGIQAEDEGGSGLAEVVLFASRDGGKTWEPVAKGGPQDRKLSFPVEPGEWWLCAGAMDNSGNSAPAPAVQARVTVMRPPLKLLVVEEPPALRGGDSFSLRWKCEPPDAKLTGGVDIHWRASPGDEWVLLASSRPPGGEFVWKAPAEDCEKARFRLEARSAGGGTASALSREFVVDASAPVAVLGFDFGEDVLPAPPEAPPAVTVREAPAPAPTKRPEPRVPAPDAAGVEALIDAGEFEGAAKAATLLLNSNPGDVGALVLRARAKALMGDLNGAEADLMRGSALPGADAARGLFPKVLLAKAVRSWEDKHQRLRYVRLALEASGEARTAEGLVSKAVGGYMLASAEAGGEGPKAEAMLRQAREEFERALAMSPGELEGICRWYLARIMEAEGRAELAREHWKRAAEFFPEGSRQREFARSKGSP